MSAELDERLEVNLAQVELTLRQCAEAIAARGMGYAVATFGPKFAGASVQIHGIHLALVAELPAYGATEERPSYRANRVEIVRAPRSPKSHCSACGLEREAARPFTSLCDECYEHDTGGNE